MIIAQLVKILSDFYETRKFIIFIKSEKGPMINPAHIHSAPLYNTMTTRYTECLYILKLYILSTHWGSVVVKALRY
jgi:hypothetical protein